MPVIISIIPLINANSSLDIMIANTPITIIAIPATVPIIPKFESLRLLLSLSLLTLLSIPIYRLVYYLSIK